jgi:hypothetical protein
VKLEPQGAVLLLQSFTQLAGRRPDLSANEGLVIGELDQVLTAVNGLLKIWPVVRRDMIWWL